MGLLVHVKCAALAYSYSKQSTRAAAAAASRVGLAFASKSRPYTDLGLILKFNPFTKPTDRPSVRPSVYKELKPDLAGQY